MYSAFIYSHQARLSDCLSRVRQTLTWSIKSLWFESEFIFLAKGEERGFKPQVFVISMCFKHVTSGTSQPMMFNYPLTSLSEILIIPLSLALTFQSHPLGSRNAPAYQSLIPVLCQSSGTPPNRCDHSKIVESGLKISVPSAFMGTSHRGPQAYRIQLARVA